MISYVKRLAELAPWWLNTGPIASLFAAIGEALDDERQRALDAVRYRWGVAGDYANALPYHEEMRRIRQGLAETDDAFALRLRNWHADHKRRGGPWALLEQLRAYFGDDVRWVIIYRSGRYYELASGDAAPADVVRDDDALWAPAEVDPADWATWQLWGWFDTDPGVDAETYALLAREWNALHCEGGGFGWAIQNDAPVVGAPGLVVGGGEVVGGSDADVTAFTM
jgi:hypothetical protein